jgi:hypothetical protein
MSPDYIKNYIEANPKEYNDPEAAVPVTPEVIEEDIKISVKTEFIINKEDIDSFNKYVSKSGSLPKEFFTSSTKFKEFYNDATGKRAKAPDSTKWFLQENGRYDLIDQETGELLISNVDLRTGKKYTEVIEEPTQPQGSVNLGTKTAPAGGNVVIDATKGRSPQPGAVVAFRTKGKTEQNMIDALVDNAVGNPFGPYAAIKVGDTGEAVTRFLNWLEGTGDTNVMQDYRNALLSKVSELKGKTIYYYKDLGRPSHATALDYFLNKPTTQPQAGVKPGVSELFNSTPELASIGTPQQYSEWINYLTTQGKLAGTQATDILYHGTDKEFDTFDKTKRGSATGEGYFQDEEQTPIDSLNAFFFSTEPAVSEQYGLLRRIEQIENLTSVLSSTLINWSSAKNIRKYSPELADHLKEKQKELSTDQLKNYIKELYKKYDKVNKELGIGFLNQYNNYIKLGKQLQDLKNKKEDIISGKYVHNSFIKDKPDLGISFYNKDRTPLAMGIYIYNDGEIRSGEFNKRNITSLSSEEFDRLITVGEESYKSGIEKLNTLMSKAKITPILYRVLLNVQKPLVKDFEGKTFVNQAYEAGAQYEASKLTNKAAKSKGKYDSVIFKNILDPYMSDNYGVFEPEQIYKLGGKEDIEGFKEFVSTQPTVSEGQLDLFEQEIEDSQNNVESKIADADSLGRNYDVSLDPEEGPNWTEEDNESDDPFMC